MRACALEEDRRHPQVRVAPELRADLASVLLEGETLNEFVETSVRCAVEFAACKRTPPRVATPSSKAVTIPCLTVFDHMRSPAH